MAIPKIGRKTREDMGLISMNLLDKLTKNRIELVGIQKLDNDKYNVVKIVVNNHRITVVEQTEGEGKPFALGKFKAAIGRLIGLV